MRLKKQNSIRNIMESMDWRFPFMHFVLYDIFTEDPKEATSVTRRANHSFYNIDIKQIYWKSYDGILLWCLSCKEAQATLQEGHHSIYGAHQPRLELWDRLRRMGYYWPKMIIYVIDYAKTYHIYQIHADYIHSRSVYLHSTAASWPFEAWGIHMVGPISPPS